MTAERDEEGLLRTRAIPPSEPRFTLRAQDEATADTIRFWAALSWKLGAPPAVIEQALQKADEVEAWPVKKVVDADHLTPERRVELEAAFAERKWSPEPEGQWRAQEMRYVAGRSEGFAAGVRSERAAMARMQRQEAVLRDEVSRLQGDVAGLEVQLADRAAAEEQADERAADDFRASLRRETA